MYLPFNVLIYMWTYMIITQKMSMCTTDVHCTLSVENKISHGTSTLAPHLVSHRKLDVDHARNDNHS